MPIENTMAIARHHRIEDNEPVPTKQTVPARQDRGKRHAHVGPVFARRLETDPPVGVALCDQRVAQHGVTEGEVLIDRGHDETDWVTRQACDSG